MATKIFPSVNDVNGGVAGQGKTLTEANLKALQEMPYLDRPYVKSGAVLSNGGGLNLNVGTGHYMIDGRWVYKDATESVLLTASSTNRVWLQLVKDGSGNVTGTQWVVQTSASVPADAVLVGEVVTGAGTITTIYTSFRGIITPGTLLGTGSAVTTATQTPGASTRGTAISTFDFVGDGYTPLDLRAVIGSAWIATGSGGGGYIISDGSGSGIPTAAGGTGVGVLGATFQSLAVAGERNPIAMEAPTYPAFVGRKTFGLYPYSSATSSIIAWEGGVLARFTARAL